jgi:hypothetical protein
MNARSLDPHSWVAREPEPGERCAVCNRRPAATVLAATKRGELDVPLCRDHFDLPTARAVVLAKQAERWPEDQAARPGRRPQGGRPQALPGAPQGHRLPSATPGTGRAPGAYPGGRDMRDLTGRPHR